MQEGERQNMLNSEKQKGRVAKTTNGAKTQRETYVDRQTVSSS